MIEFSFFPPAMGGHTSATQTKSVGKLAETFVGVADAGRVDGI